MYVSYVRRPDLLSTSRWIAYPVCLAINELCGALCKQMDWFVMHIWDCYSLVPPVVPGAWNAWTYYAQSSLEQTARYLIRGIADHSCIFPTSLVELPYRSYSQQASIWHLAHFQFNAESGATGYCSEDKRCCGNPDYIVASDACANHLYLAYAL